MAEFTRGQTFQTNDTVTSTKLHNLIDLATIANIVNADISASAAIDDTKLAQITTAAKVSAKALTLLASLPTGAGYIPSANLATIPNASLLPISLASWVDGGSLKNLASIPSSAGVIPGANIGGLLGSWLSRSADTAYYATTAGFITGTINGGQLDILTDASNPPTTSRQVANIATTRGIVCCPVAKGDYYKAAKTGGTVETLYWLPMGA